MIFLQILILALGFVALVKGADEIEIVAEVGGNIAGLAGIERVGTQEKLRHRAEFGISIDRAYWGLGIGARWWKPLLSTRGGRATRSWNSPLSRKTRGQSRCTSARAFPSTAEIRADFALALAISRLFLCGGNCRGKR